MLQIVQAAGVDTSAAVMDPRLVSAESRLGVAMAGLSRPVSTRGLDSDIVFAVGRLSLENVRGNVVDSLSCIHCGDEVRRWKGQTMRRYRAEALGSARGGPDSLLTKCVAHVHLNGVVTRPPVANRSRRSRLLTRANIDPCVIGVALILSALPRLCPLLFSNLYTRSRQHLSDNQVPQPSPALL